MAFRWLVRNDRLDTAINWVRMARFDRKTPEEALYDSLSSWWGTRATGLRATDEEQFLLAWVDQDPQIALAELAAVLGHLDEESLVECQFCRCLCPPTTAHRHARGWVGDECGCWEQLRRSE